MIILGVNIGHDPSAAILRDGELVAACDEERFTRKKHGIGQMPVSAIKFCITKAGLTPDDIRLVAFPYSKGAYRRHKWAFAKRACTIRGGHSISALINTDAEHNRLRSLLVQSLLANGFDINKIDFRFVEHHLAHAASVFYASGFDEAAIMSMDGAGEFTATLFAEGKTRDISIVKEFIYPDSLGFFYSTVTEYLGFQINDGEYKLMGMAPYGNPQKIDAAKLVKYDKFTYVVNNDYIWVRKKDRYNKKRIFSKKMVSEWGPPREGDGLTEPYIHIAAATQKLFEDVTITLMETYLGDSLKRHKTLCFAGGCALNVSLNRKLLAHPLVERLFVQPAAHDSGTALGAASYVANMLGDKIKPMKHAYYGPSYTNDEIKDTLSKYKIRYTYHEDITGITSKLLAEGKIVAWFQGAMEYGPRALGNRSILAHPSRPRISDEINERIKFREKWRPFCPSVLPEYQEEIFGTKHPSGFMTLSFNVRPAWQDKIKEAVHVDGTARPQVVDKEANPKFYKLLQEFHKLTGIPVLINTSLNRRGEPMVCSPQDAINMFYGSGLEYMAMGNYLIRK